MADGIGEEGGMMGWYWWVAIAILGPGIALVTALVIDIERLQHGSLTVSGPLSRVKGMDSSGDWNG